MIQAFGDLMFIVDEDGMILDDKSGNVLQLNAIFPRNYRVRKIQDLFPVEAGQKIIDGLQAIHEKNKIIQVEYSLPTLVGKSWHESRFVPASNRQVIIFIRDITKYKQSEEKIKIQLDQLAALRAIDLAITSGADLSQTLSMILENVQKYLNIDAASVLLLNPQTNALNLPQELGFRTSAIQHTHLRLARDWPDRRYRNRRIVHVPNLKNRKTGLLRSPDLQQRKFHHILRHPFDREGTGIGCV